jgi:transcriptional regulator with XRE-family HTH domain
MTTNTISNYPAIIGHQVKKIRTRIGMTQLDVAERCGLFRTYLSRIESGKANPTITVLAELAQTLKVDIRELLAEDPID